MYYELYIDQFFAENLLIGYLLLELTVLSFGKKRNRRKLFLAAVENAAANTLLVIFGTLQSPNGKIWQQLILAAGYIGSAAGAVRIVFGKTKISTFGKQMLCWLLNTIFFAGIQEVISRTVHISASAAVLPTAFLIGSLLKYYVKRQGCKSQTAEVTVFWDDKKLGFTGIVDTGNMLQEPLTGKAVSIVEKSAVLPLLGENWQQKKGFYLIPYHSIGTEKGWLQAVKMDRMEIQTGKKRSCIEQPILAIYEGNLGVQKNYQIILHPWHADEKGE